MTTLGTKIGRAFSTFGGKALQVMAPEIQQRVQGATGSEGLRKVAGMAANDGGDALRTQI